MALLFAALFVLYREPENARLIDVVGSLEALYVIAAERMIDQRSALALNVARQKLMHLSLGRVRGAWCDGAGLPENRAGARGGRACIPGTGRGCAAGAAEAGARDRRRRSATCSEERDRLTEHGAGAGDPE